jgi:hypothetical protein
LGAIVGGLGNPNIYKKIELAEPEKSSEILQKTADKIFYLL